LEFVGLKPVLRQGDPRINIQKDGNMAKLYQVKIVQKALVKLSLQKEWDVDNEKE